MARAPKQKRTERFCTEQQTQQQSTNPEIASCSYSSPSVLPPGYRFAPKDEELILVLHQRQQNSCLNLPVHHMNIYDDKVDYALCKIFRTPRAEKKKMKKEEDLAIVDQAQVFAEEVEQSEYQQQSLMMMMQEAGEEEEEQQQHQQVTWSLPRSYSGSARSRFRNGDEINEPKQ